jgi:hypothetical protein
MTSATFANLSQLKLKTYASPARNNWVKAKSKTGFRLEKCLINTIFLIGSVQNKF